MTTPFLDPPSVNITSTSISTTNKTRQDSTVSTATPSNRQGSTIDPTLRSILLSASDYLIPSARNGRRDWHPPDYWREYFHFHFYPMTGRASLFMPLGCWRRVLTVLFGCRCSARGLSLTFLLPWVSEQQFVLFTSYFRRCSSRYLPLNDTRTIRLLRNTATAIYVNPTTRFSPTTFNS